LEDEERGRLEDEERGRWGEWQDGESGKNFFLLPSSFFLLPSSFFLLTNSRARHPRVQWRLRVGNWEQRVQAKQEECPDLPQSC
jgi:hypothetical protein